MTSLEIWTHLIIHGLTRVKFCRTAGSQIHMYYRMTNIEWPISYLDTFIASKVNKPGNVSDCLCPVFIMDTWPPIKIATVNVATFCERRNNPSELLSASP